MQACVLHTVETGPKVEEVEVLDPQPGEVVVRIAASGVCGSDMHVIHGRSVIDAYPMVLGHEGAGVVEAVGPGVESVRPGDHVVVALYGPCMQCHNCLTGNVVHCNGAARMSNIFGRMADGSTRLRQGDQPLYPFVGCGSLAEYAVVRSTMVVPVPDDVPLDVIALAGCGVTTGLGAVFNTAKVAPGDTVAVLGCGGVGLNVVQGARIAGATRIVAIDTNPMKLGIAEKVGATHTVNVSQDDMKSAVAAAVPGGVDFSFEVVGNPDLVAAAFELTKPGGSCVMVGSPPTGSKIPVDGRALFSERRLLGTTGGSNIPHRDIPRIVELYRTGRLDLDSLISQRLPLADVQKAFDAADAGTVARSVITF
jgi:S-(hydroxymethyl)glutathione dehydrogenase/alcohol dehydrogenase